MDLRPGVEVTPNVRLESHLAKGAMGEVWTAEHATLHITVAVKFISNRLDPDDPEVLERFVREASTAAQINSSHVVRTFDQGVMRDGTPYCRAAPGPDRFAPDRIAGRSVNSGKLTKRPFMPAILRRC